MTIRLRCLFSSLILGLLAGAAPGAATTSAAQAPPRPLIVFMSDFGQLDDAVAICKGVMKTVSPGTEIIDLSHDVTPFSIAEGARLLVRTSQYYPRGTVFVTVIDPGVGTARKAIVLKTKRSQYFVLPDNGLVTRVADRDGIEGVREISNAKWLLPGSSSSTFHGRDIFSPVAAHLAAGWSWSDVGRPLPGITRLEAPQATIDASGIHGQVVALDGPYGNLVTNIDSEDFRRLGFRYGDAIRVRIGEAAFAVPYAATFGAVATGESFLFIDSRGLVSLAINQGSFAKAHGITPPATFNIARP